LGSIEHKGECDLVTIADKESEAAVMAVVRNHFPGHDLLGEETGAAPGHKGAEYRWIIDPLDGTTNFAHSMPLFSVSIGVERTGEVVAGGVFNPFYGERFLAERGAGATLNGRRIRVSETAALSESLLVTGFPHDKPARMREYLAEWALFLGRVHGIVRLGSAALDMCFVACGRLDCFWQRKLQPWDTAAGWVIVEEAGGRVTDFSGNRYSPFGQETLVTNGRIHDECIGILGAGR
jgi:myo-inositol-1(or 4)-monophosphatase